MEDRMLMQKMIIGSEFSGVRKGAWSPEEDLLLRKCVAKHGEGQWHLVPTRAGLRRCRKSCRLRWVNYLKPNIKKGVFGEDEVDLIIRLHRLLGNRWSLIAGRIPGRTANDIKNIWNSCLGKKVSPNLDDSSNNKAATARSTHAVEPPKQYCKPPRHAAGIVETVGSSSTVLLAPSYSVIKPQPGIPSKSFGLSILPKNNNVGTRREASREPSTVVTDGTIVHKEADPLPWLRDLLGVVLEEEEEEKAADGVDGRQRQLQEVLEQENLIVDKEADPLPWLRDLLGVTLEEEEEKAADGVDGWQRQLQEVPEQENLIVDKEADPLPWLRDLLGVTLEEEEEKAADGVDGRQRQLQEVPERENLGYSFPRGGAQEGEVEFPVTGRGGEEVGSDEGKYWWTWEDVSFLHDEELTTSQLGDLLGLDL